jgi:ABC-type cobalamin/Fe3+-siderophores transport system ATPase subunit
MGALGTGHVDRPATTLSPGERTRAELALLSATGVNCLVLDEPTNHLDLPAIEQLEQALESFDGTLLLVTHDRGLIDALRFTPPMGELIVFQAANLARSAAVRAPATESCLVSLSFLLVVERMFVYDSAMSATLTSVVDELVDVDASEL